MHSWKKPQYSFEQNTKKSGSNIALSLKPDNIADLQNVADLIGRTNVEKLSFPCYLWPIEGGGLLARIIKAPSNLVSLDVGLLSDMNSAFKIGQALAQNTQLSHVKLWVSENQDPVLRLRSVEIFCRELKNNNILRHIEVRLPYTIPGDELADVRRKFNLLKNDIITLFVEYIYYSSLWGSA